MSIHYLRFRHQHYCFCWHRSHQLYQRFLESSTYRRKNIDHYEWHIVLHLNKSLTYFNPVKTSSTCPRCGSRLKDNGDRVLQCTRCGFTGDRDVIACINLFLRYSRCGVLGVALNAPKGDANPRPMRGNRDEAMKNCIRAEPLDS
ncbi:MAG: zinc ribbon domain-containing protein, partial [Desulfurococcaceae archaeon]